MKKFSLFLVILLLVATLNLAVAQNERDCKTIFFSEYVEGSNNNKALEIYNPTGEVIDLTGYSVKRYSNGSVTDPSALPLSGSIQPYDVFTISNGQADSVWVEGGGYWSLPVSEELYNMMDFHCSGEYPTPMYFNGNDALTLEKSDGTILDIFAQVGGGDPGPNGWNDQPPSYLAGDEYWTSWTKDQTLIRKSSVKHGVSYEENPATFNVTLEWDSLPKDTWDHLGWHECECNETSISNPALPAQNAYFFPNPVTNNTFMIKATAIIRDIEIVNILGQTMHRQTNPARRGDMFVRLEKEYNGIYLVKINFENDQSIIKKILIK